MASFVVVCRFKSGRGLKRKEETAPVDLPHLVGSQHHVIVTALGSLENVGGLGEISEIDYR